MKTLPMLQKPMLGKEVLLGDNVKILNTGVDGIPYTLDRAFYNFQKGDKIRFAGSVDLYTIKTYDVAKGEATFKLDKMLDLSQRTVEQVKQHFTAWGMKKEADKIKANYRIGLKDYVVEGKLNKNQVIYNGNWHMRITDIIKTDTIPEVKYEFIETKIMQPVFPYKENDRIKTWYYDIQDVWVRQSREYLKKVIK